MPSEKQSCYRRGQVSPGGAALKGAVPHVGSLRPCLSWLAYEFSSSLLPCLWKNEGLLPSSLQCWAVQQYKCFCCPHPSLSSCCLVKGKEDGESRAALLGRWPQMGPVPGTPCCHPAFHPDSRCCHQLPHRLTVHLHPVISIRIYTFLNYI